MISYDDIKIGVRVSAGFVHDGLRTCKDGEIAGLKDGCYAWVRGWWEGATTETKEIVGHWVHFNDLGPPIVESESQPVAGLLKCKMCTAPVTHGLHLESGHWLCTPCVIKTCETHHNTNSKGWRLRAEDAHDALAKIIQEAQACLDGKSP